MSSTKDAPPGGGQPLSGLDDELDLDFGFEEPPPPRLNLGNKPELRRILSRLQEGTKSGKPRQGPPEKPRQGPPEKPRQGPPEKPRQGPPEKPRLERSPPPENAQPERPLEVPAPPVAVAPEPLPLSMPLPLPEPEEEPEPEEPPLFYELRAKERPKLIVAGGVDEARAYVPPTKMSAPATRGKVMETLRVKIKDTPEPSAPVDPRSAVTTRLKPGGGAPLDPRKAATMRMKPRDPMDPRQAVTMKVAPPDPANPRQAATMKLPTRDPYDPRHAIARRMDLRPLRPSGEYPDDTEVDLEGEYEEIGPGQAPRKLPEPYIEPPPYAPPYAEEPAEEEEPPPRIGVWLAVIAGAAILGGGIALLVRRSAMSDDPAGAASARPAITAPQQAAPGPAPAPDAAAPSAAAPNAPAPR